MEKQVFIEMVEKTTAPGLTAVVQKDTGDAGGIYAINQAPTDVRQQLQGGGRPQRQPIQFFRGYGAALVMSLPVLPIVVSAVTIGIYLSNPSASGWFSVLFGAVFTYIAWIVISLFLVPLTSPASANAHSYGLLLARWEQLITRLNIIESTTSEQDLQPYQQVALGEAFDKFDELNHDINGSQRRLPWVMGAGYVNAWGKLHCAEEALVEVEPVEMVLRGALHDKLALTNSQLSNRDELLAKLRYAAKLLDPAMVDQFKPFGPAGQSENEREEVERLRRDVRRIAQHINFDLGDNPAPARGTTASHDPEDAARARLTIREVKNALNNYRDHLWEGLVRARNNLLGTMFVTGLVTHVLLCVAILALTPVNGSTSANRGTIIAAVAYYMVGAIAGLFGRISRASMANIGVDDYGLSFAQMISRPLYSGLAGLGGVLISSTVISIGAQSGLNMIQSIFTIDRPEFLIIAAAFGLAPTLIPNQFAGGLQNQTNRFLTALSTSKTSTIDANANTNAEQSVGD